MDLIEYSEFVSVLGLAWKKNYSNSITEPDISDEHLMYDRHIENQNRRNIAQIHTLFN